VELVSEVLAGVTFVHDYVQLQFGSPPTLNVYMPITVRGSGVTSRSGDRGFADALVGQIAKKVGSVRKQPSQRLEIVFDDASSIEISLRPEDYKGPEAFEYFGSDGGVLIE